MGRRGPAPVPTFMLKLRRSKLAGRNPDEPRPAPGIGPCPDWLSPAGQAMYNRLSTVLMTRQALTPLDAPALIRYCDAWSRWCEAARFLDKHGTMYEVKDRSGRTRGFKPWPQVNAYHAHGKILGKLEREFGLTPSTRSTVQVPGAPALRNAPHWLRKTG